MADVLLMLGLPLMATQNAISYWPFGPVLCRLVMTAGRHQQFTSIFCLTVMSVDRYLAVVTIRSAVGRPGVAKLASAAVWAALRWSCRCRWWCLPTSRRLEHPCQPQLAGARGGCGGCVHHHVRAGLLRAAAGHLPVLRAHRGEAEGVRRNVGSAAALGAEGDRMVVVVVLVLRGCWLPFFIVSIVNLTLRCPRSPPLPAPTSSWLCCPMPLAVPTPCSMASSQSNFRQSFRKVLCLHTSFHEAAERRGCGCHGASRARAAGCRRP